LLVLSTPEAAQAALGHGTAIRPAELLRPGLCELVLHPCQQAAAHLAYRTPRAFVTTRAGTDTMARHRQDTDEEADDTAGAATFGGASLRGTRQVTPPSLSTDLRTALAMPTTFGPKLFEITALLAVSAACKLKVKDAR
jgi:hypothetical protein